MLEREREDTGETVRDGANEAGNKRGLRMDEGEGREEGGKEGGNG